MDVDLRRGPNVHFQLELPGEMRQILSQEECALYVEFFRWTVHQRVVMRPLSLGFQVLHSNLDGRLSEVFDLLTNFDLGSEPAQKARILGVDQREFVARAQIVIALSVQLLVYTHEPHVKRVAVSWCMAAGGISDVLAE